MDEQNRYPHDSHGEHDDPRTPTGPPTGPPSGESAGESARESAGGSGGPGWTGERDEHTRPIPAYRPAGESETTQPQAPWTTMFGQASDPERTRSGPPRRSRGLAAAVLVGALVLGGAAGVGGSAAYRAFGDDSSASTPTGSSAKPFEATTTSVVKDGTVEKVAQAVLPSVAKVNVAGQSGAGSGSGIVLSKDGKILTNNHVVALAGDGGSITVNFNDGSTKRATVIGTDSLTDVAVIQVQGVSDLTPASLGKSGELAVGQAVVAVGSPYGLDATVTSGIVSALNRPVSVSTQEETPQSPFGGDQGSPFGGGQQQGQQQGQDLSTTYPAIQTDAAINPGNSGGPLVDMSGRVVGINSSIRTSSSDTSGGSGGSIGLGFAIPIDEVLPIVNQITDNQQPTHARLGVSVTDVDSNGTSRGNGADNGTALTQGALLRTVDDGSAAQKAGLKTGDVITKVDAQVIDGSESLVATIRGHRPADKVEITYLRGGKTATATADLGSDESTTSS